MKALRRYIAPIALVLAAVVSVQVLDMDLCCEDRPSACEAASGQHGPADGAVLHAGVDGDHAGHGHASSPDCLCHLLFVSTSARPDVLAPLAPLSSAIEAPEILCSAPSASPGHVPLGRIHE